MRLGTIADGDRTRAFTTDGAVTTYFDARDVGELLHLPRAEWAGRVGPSPDPMMLLQPILRPGKIVCVGLNYHDHAAEVGKPAPDYPTLFAKFATALVGPTSNILLPAVSTRMDWEAELAIVIGAPARNLDQVAALDAILGYTVLNDVSARDWQQRTSEWLQGKNFDATTPLGPTIVTTDEFDPTEDHEIRTTVDGRVEQLGTTSNMIFSPAQIVSYISTFMTLEPGDIIATGTPAGVGFIQAPPRYLAPGSRVETHIAGIGTLTNLCVETPLENVLAEKAEAHGHH
jgi:acylpyruvate hydrolase